MQPLLTLAIPTYNRSTYVARLLETVFEQFVSDPRFELLISDNCSTDDTSAVIDSFRSRNLSLRYIRNESNIGPDANFLQCFDQAAGKYFWLLGDDDVLAPNALRQILSLLEQGEPGAGERVADFNLVYLSTFAFSGQYDHRPGVRRRKPLVHFSEIVTSGNYFLNRVNALVGLISCIIVNKNRLIEGGYLPLENLDKSLILQLAWVLPAIREKTRILYVWEQLVGYHLFNSSGWSPCQIFGVNVPRTASQHFREEPSLARSLSNGILRYWLPNALIEMRLGKHPGLIWEDCLALLAPRFKANPHFWIFVYPVAVFPLWMARPVYACSMLVNKVTRVSQVILRSISGRMEYLEPR